MESGVNIGIIFKLLGHASIQVTLDSYASVMDELIMNNVRLIRDKLVIKDDRFILKDLTDESAQDELTKKNLGDKRKN